MAGPEQSAGARDRIGAIDLLKAVATLVVVAIHASRIAPQHQLSPLELTLARAFHFAVPAFLFCSGYLLQAPGPIPWAVTRRRLARILQPYLVASLLAFAYRAALGQVVAPLRDLLFFNAFGPFYYVFLIVTLIGIAPALATVGAVGRRMFVGAYLVLGAALGGVRGLSPVLPWLNLLMPVAIIVVSLRDRRALRAAVWLGMSWWTLLVGLQLLRFYKPPFVVGVPMHLRNPGFNWGYFLVGWELRALLRSPATAARFERWRPGLALACAISASALLVHAAKAPVGMFAWPAFPYSLSVTLGLFAIAIPWRWTAATPLRHLSDASYTVYLFHLFAILPLRRLGVAHENPLLTWKATPVLWLAGLVLSLGLTWLARGRPKVGPWIGLRTPGTRSANLGS